MTENTVVAQSGVVQTGRLYEDEDFCSVRSSLQSKLGSVQKVLRHSESDLMTFLAPYVAVNDFSIQFIRRNL
jgi:hypothetical protein